MRGKRTLQSNFYLVIFLISLIFTTITYFIKPYLAYTEFGIIVVLFISYFIVKKRFVKDRFLSLKNLADNLDIDNKEAFDNLPMPMTLVDSEGTIIWYNDLFFNRVAADIKIESSNITEYIPEISLSELVSLDGIPIGIGKRTYTVFSSKTSGGNKNTFALFFFDTTQLKIQADNYFKVKPVVLLGYYDNYDNLYKEYTDGERAEIKSGVDRIVENWFSQYKCVLKRLGSERFIIIAHEEDLKNMIEKKFEILRTIRSYEYNGQLSNITLSMGVGTGKNLRECEKNARLSLDMALSRGGDQVAIKTKDDFKFFGGIKNNADRSNKVKSRVVASAICQLIEGCDNVLIMGHKFSDLDVIGAAIGIYSIVRSLKKEAFIVCDKSKTLAEQLVNEYVSSTGNNPFIEPLSAPLRMDKRSIVFVLDTHRGDLTEAPEILEKAQSIVVIDHHRKAVDYIKNAVVFHHDIGASSTCEMVAELLPYIGERSPIGKSEADALFSGIMLDTRNFVLRTGVRTFEAAAFLKSRGADAVRVKRLFSTSIVNYQKRNDIITKAEIYRECAISVTDGIAKDVRVISSQAADELLNISGVKSSFVIFPTSEGVNISARSLGEMNVQVIMESLGGGGHNTMAAVQLKDVTIHDTTNLLHEAIEKYYNNIN